MHGLIHASYVRRWACHVASAHVQVHADRKPEDNLSLCRCDTRHAKLPAMTETLLILDGGTGRELARRGAPFRQPEWSALALIEGPQFVSAVHRAYVEAGADVITTNSYALVPFHIGVERFASEGALLAARAGQLARDVADASSHSVRVAGSLPPVCGSYRPDLVDLDRARPILNVLIGALAPNVDHWLAETLSSLAEARLCAMLTAPTGKALWLSFTLEDDGATDAPALRSGESVAEAAYLAQEVGAAALLFNCSQPEVMEAAISSARDTWGAERDPHRRLCQCLPTHGRRCRSKFRAQPDPCGLDARRLCPLRGRMVRSRRLYIGWLLRDWP